MNRLRLLALAATALAYTAVAGPVSAEALTPQDRTEIATLAATLDRAISAGDMTAAMNIVPPRLLNEIARRAGMTPDQLRAATRQAMSAALEGVTVVSFDIDLAAAEELKTPDGSRAYLLIPTEIVMKAIGVGGMRSRSHTLAIEDEGEWYLISVDEAPQIALVRQLWPEFAGVDFPTGTMAAVD